MNYERKNVPACKKDQNKRKDDKLSSYVITELKNVGDKRAIRPLINALPQKGPIEREWIGETLMGLTGESFGQDYEKWNAWYEGNKDKLIKGK